MSGLMVTEQAHLANRLTRRDEHAGSALIVIATVARQKVLNRPGAVQSLPCKTRTKGTLGNSSAFIWQRLSAYYSLEE